MKPMWQLFSGAADEGFISTVIDTGSDQELIQATTFNQNNDEGLHNRNSKISWLSHRSDMRDYLFEYVKKANRLAYGFHVDNVADLQYTEYDGKVKGHYGWHVDVDWMNTQPYDRKLSVTVQLSDPNEYEGGDFIIEGESPDPEQAKQKGSILIFPSYASHQVTPVTSGLRRSLVAWFEGPKWR